MLKCKKIFYIPIDNSFFLHIIRMKKEKEVIIMKLDEMFEQRSLVASKLKDCIRLYFFM